MAPEASVTIPMDETATAAAMNPVEQRRKYFFIGLLLLL